ncbi:MAG TPA: hypothetical protein VGG69_02560, partial [Rhizomicrobium sp.]
AVSFRIYPKRPSFFSALESAFGGSVAGARAIQGLAAIEQLPVVRAVLGAMVEAQQGGVQMKAVNLPIN